MKKLIVPFILLSLFLLSGCALTNEQMVLNYKPNLSAIKKVNSSKRLVLAKFTDQRGVNPKALTHKINLNEQQAKGLYLAEKPIAEILRTSVDQGLKHAGYKVGKKGAYKLQGSLVALDFKWIEGWVNSTLYSNIQMEFTLVDAHSGKQVWDQMYNGSGKYFTGDNLGTPYKIAFRRAANNLITKFVNSNEFNAMMK